MIEGHVTKAVHTVGAIETVTVIDRVGPKLTEIRLPPLADRNGLPLKWADLSTSLVEDHEVRFIPDGTETVMTKRTFSAWSNSSSLASGWLYPTKVGWIT